jgi:transketolase
MRTAFIEALTKLAAVDPRITLIVGDLGFGVVDGFARRFPNQFLNAGVAEQNMTGLAAGMALAGKVVFTYSIANFPTLRCLEQIRNDVCYHGANVKVVSVGGGLGYGALGMSHHATEDLAILRALPGLTVISPGDPLETECAVEAAAACPGPFYLRLGRAGEPLVHETRPDFQVGKALVVREGSDLTLIATGTMLPVAVEASDKLAIEGISTRVLSVHTVKPLDSDAVVDSAWKTRFVATLEEHSVVGGLGGAVAEVLAESAVRGLAFKRLGLPSEYSSAIGDRDYLRRVHGLDTAGVLSTLRCFIDGRNRIRAPRVARITLGGREVSR